MGLRRPERQSSDGFRSDNKGKTCGHRASEPMLARWLQAPYSRAIALDGQGASSSPVVVLMDALVSSDEARRPNAAMRRSVEFHGCLSRA